MSQEKKKSARDIQHGGTHYATMAIQPSDFIYKNKLNWFAGNAVKYICRYQLKGGDLDLDKAIHYLQLLKEEEYGSTKTNKPGASVPTRNARRR